MKSISRILLLAALILTPVGAVGAQEPLPPGCDGAMLGESLTAIQDKFSEAQALVSDDDAEGALQAFNEAAGLVDKVRATCGLGIAVSGGAAEPGVVEPGMVEPGVIVVEPVMPMLPEDTLCGEYPQYCVPMAGGPIIEGWPVESPELRPAIDEAAGVTDGTAGVVRGVSEAGAPFIGDPNA
ncbi:MAG: hypothetical protein EHM39_14005, partial [Chloroflexi bacterium]